MLNATILASATGSRADLFWSKVAIGTEDECWNWNGAHNERGYGVGGWRVDGRWANWKAHRLAYLLTFGEFPDELTIDHMCMNRACVNPSHLEPVTGFENVQRATLLKTHCANQHPLTDENVLIIHRTGQSPYRQCRTCLRNWKATTYDRLLERQGKTRVKAAA